MGFLVIDKYRKIAVSAAYAISLLSVIQLKQVRDVGEALGLVKIQELRILLPGRAGPRVETLHGSGSGRLCQQLVCALLAVIC